TLITRDLVQIEIIFVINARGRVEFIFDSRESVDSAEGASAFARQLRVVKRPVYRGAGERIYTALRDSISVWSIMISQRAAAGGDSNQAIELVVSIVCVFPVGTDGRVDFDLVRSITVQVVGVLKDRKNRTAGMCIGNSENSVRRVIIADGERSP